jgi:hydroxymethylbilane synthase
MSVLRIGSRQSRLALAQAGLVAERLRAGDDRVRVEVREFVTAGDRILDRPVHEIGTKGLFTRELDAALLGGEIDLAVHSAKDLPVDLPEGVVLAAVPEREDPRDALVALGPATLEGLPGGTRLGTSSLRRRAQLADLRPDLAAVPMRGNLDTRWRKLEAGECDGLLLAAAGMARLGWGERVRERLSSDLFVPAPCQGALAVTARAGDEETLRRAAAIEDPRSRLAVDCERSFLAALGGGCAIPAGALAAFGEDGALGLVVYLASPRSGESLRLRLTGAASQAKALGRRAAEDLLQGEGRAWIAAAREGAP